MTPVSEEVARVALRRFTPEPVNVYVPELRQLVEKITDREPIEEMMENGDFEDDDDNYEGG
jgi:hypothetical protein